MAASFFWPRKTTKKHEEYRIQNTSHGLHGSTRIAQACLWRQAGMHGLAPLNPSKGDFEDANSLYNHFLYRGVKVPVKIFKALRNNENSFWLFGIQLRKPFIKVFTNYRSLKSPFGGFRGPSCLLVAPSLLPQAINPC